MTSTGCLPEFRTPRRLLGAVRPVWQPDSAGGVSGSCFNGTFTASPAIPMRSVACRTTALAMLYTMNVRLHVRFGEPGIDGSHTKQRVDRHLHLRRRGPARTQDRFVQLGGRRLRPFVTSSALSTPLPGPGCGRSVRWRCAPGNLLERRNLLRSCRWLGPSEYARLSGRYRFRLAVDQPPFGEGSAVPNQSPLTSPAKNATQNQGMITSG